MSTELPVFTISQNHDGTVSTDVSTVSTDASVDPNALAAVNWAALIQAIMAIIAAFTGGSPTPPPVKN